MGAYERWILPRLLDLAMRAREATRYRMEVIPAASGHVLEIGMGSGLNLPFTAAQSHGCTGSTRRGHSAGKRLGGHGREHLDSLHDSECRQGAA